MNSFKRVIFYWDRDAYPQAETYSRKLQSDCRVVCHSDGQDAGSRSIGDNSRLLRGAVSFGSVKYEMFKLVELSC